MAIGNPFPIFVPGFLFAAGVLFGVGLRYIKRLYPCPNVAFILPGDEDMKVVGERFPAAKPKPDAYEDEIRLYFQHKHNGNIQLAKHLGEKLGQAIIQFQYSHTPPYCPENSPLMTAPRTLDDQARMLYIYVAQAAAKEHSPDSILSQMVIASLNDTVEDTLPDFYKKMSDCRAFTIYKLCSTRRDTPNLPLYMGQAFAQLLGCKDDSQLAHIGSTLYTTFQSASAKLFASHPFEAVTPS